MTTPHQPEKQLNYCKTCVQMTNHKGEVCLKCQPENGYENATDEEKTKMMLQIAKEANAEQKAMFERTCLCKDKGVIELIEEAVEAERARIREGVETALEQAIDDANIRDEHGGTGKETAKIIAHTILNLPALQVINKQE